MIIHESEYENKGWIPTTREFPEINHKVRLCSINIIDWNIEEMEWETTGWYKGNNTWSMKEIKDINRRKLMHSKPTHWKNI